MRHSSNLIVGVPDMQFLAFGNKLFPRDGMIQFELAVMDRKLGSLDEARCGLDGVLAAADTHPVNVVSYAK
jgi:hypothetical protein